MQSNKNMGLSKTLIFSDTESLTKAAVIYFAQVAHESIKERGRFLVALSGGETSIQLYELLGKSPYREYLPWEQIHLFWCDEKCVLPDNPENHYHLAWQNWLKYTLIPGENIHRIQTEKNQPDAVEDYIQQLHHFAPEGQDWPIFDWVLLNFGRHGQVASLFPGSEYNSSSNEMVVSVNYPTMGKLADRICLSPNLINLSRQIVIMAQGSDKAQALASTVNEEKDIVRWPAQRIQPKEGLLVWMVDEAATRYSVS